MPADTRTTTRLAREPGNDRDAALPPPLRELVVRWLARASVAAFVISLVVHVIGWLASTLITFSGAGPAPVAGGRGEVDVAVMTQTEFDELNQAAASLDAPAVPEANKDVPTPDDLAEPTIADDAAGSVGEISDLADLGGAGEVSLGGADLGAGQVGGAKFFGVEAAGNRFAYIVDVSGSMAFAGKLEHLQRELTRSIASLLETSRYLVIPFADDAKPLGDKGKAEWTEASSAGKRWAKTHIDLLQALGGTRPVNGFRLAFATRPKPDAIYFMTDGDFPLEWADEIALLNRRLKVPIHCICFSDAAGEEVMKKIAKDSRGTYTFVPGPKE